MKLQMALHTPGDVRMLMYWIFVHCLRKKCVLLIENIQQTLMLVNINNCISIYIKLNYGFDLLVDDLAP